MLKQWTKRTYPKNVIHSSYSATKRISKNVNTNGNTNKLNDDITIIVINKNYIIKNLMAFFISIYELLD